MTQKHNNTSIYKTEAPNKKKTARIGKRKTKRLSFNQKRRLLKKRIPPVLSIAPLISDKIATAVTRLFFAMLRSLVLNVLCDDIVVRQAPLTEQDNQQDTSEQDTSKKNTSKGEEEEEHDEDIADFDLSRIIKCYKSEAENERLDNLLFKITNKKRIHHQQQEQHVQDDDILEAALEDQRRQDDIDLSI
jgi:hypothetical protein